MGSTDIADINLPGEEGYDDYQIMFNQILDLFNTTFGPPTIISRVNALSYTPEEQSKYLKREISTQHRSCCETSCGVGYYQWVDSQTNAVFCDHCALKYGWRKERPVDLLANNIARCFILLSERNLRFPNYSTRDKVFDQAANFILEKPYIFKLFELEKNVISDPRIENALTQWTEEFKINHQNMLEIEDDPDATCILMGCLLSKFPLELYLLPKEIPKDIPKSKWQRERYHPYRLLRHKEEVDTIPNPKYSEIKKIIDDMNQICIKTLKIHCLEWNEDEESYFGIIREAFPLQHDLH